MSRMLTKDRRGRVTTSSGYNYNSLFLARDSVHHALIADCLQATNRPLLAQQLEADPYEAEILRNDHYTKSVISGVLAESGSMASPVNIPSAWVVCVSARPVINGETAAARIAVRLTLAEYISRPRPGVTR